MDSRIGNTPCQADGMLKRNGWPLRARKLSYARDESDGQEIGC